MAAAWTHHSTALEGNTLSLRQVRRVLLYGAEAVPGKSLRECLEVADHGEAVRWLWTAVAAGVGLSEGLVREMHRLVVKSTCPGEAGRYRRGQVGIAGSRHLPPPAPDVPGLVRELVEEHRAMAGAHPVERAAVCTGGSPGCTPSRTQRPDGPAGHELLPDG